MRERAKPSTRSRWMSHELAFLGEALKEWRKLDAITLEQFKAKLMSIC